MKFREKPAEEETEKLRRERDKALDSARSSIRDTTRVTRLLTVLNDPAPIAILLDNILSTISELFSADIVVLLDPAGTGNYSPLASVGLPEEDAHTLAFEFDTAAMSEAVHGDAAGLRRALKENKAPGEDLRKLGAHTVIWIPLKGSQELRGALALARCIPSPFSKEDISLLCSMTYRIGLTLEQAQRKAQLELIVTSSRELGRCIDAAALFERAIDDIPTLTGSDAAVLFHKGEDQTLTCAGCSGIHGPDSPEWVPLKEFLSAQSALLNGETIRVADMRSLVPRLSSVSPPCGYRALLAVPIFHDPHIHGIICALRKDAIDFTPDMGQIVSLYSRQLGTELERARLYQALRDELGERERIEISLRKSEERFKALVHNVSDVIAVLQADGIVEYLSEAASKSWGIEPADLVGRSLLGRIHPDDEGAFLNLIADSRLKPKENLSAVIRLRKGESQDESGNYRYFDAILTNLLQESSVAGIVSIFHDITASKLHENELSEKALHDPLTKLANRAYFSDRVRVALSRAPENGSSVILIFIDLDDFKRVNDSLGHAAGDLTLRTAADRIRSCLRSGDLAARLGGDEFAILIEGAQRPEQLVPLLDRLLSSIKAPIDIDGRIVRIGCSLGVSSNDADEKACENADSLLHKADAAMYAAKRLGKGRYVFFDPASGSMYQPSR
jgi:diguanylate cyclase (GGDEF)-like protein/PAS domain S-box-containing protein